MQNFTATLSEEQWSVIGEALSGLPYRISAPVINALNEQFKKTAVEVEEEKNQGSQ
jgi:hypothetical protein